MRAIDTKVLVRLLVRDEGAQVAAAETFVEPRSAGANSGRCRGHVGSRSGFRSLR